MSSQPFHANKTEKLKGQNAHDGKLAKGAPKFPYFNFI